MQLKNVIKFLEQRDPDKVVPIGFDTPHSYRGYYHELAFEPKENTTVGDMLRCAREALGETYQGWKGGEYTMSGDTTCYLAEMGCCGEEIGPVLLRYMVGEASQGEED